MLGVKSMRMNSPQALGPEHPAQRRSPRGPGDGYPRNIDIVPLLAAAIESHKEMADFGGNLGIKVTIENHWGLAADPINIRIIIDEVNHPYCEASPDFGNWEHDYMLFNGLKALAPYATSNVHAKYWDRWGDKNDVQRSTRIMLAGRLQGHVRARVRAGAAQRRRRREVSLQGSARGADDADAGHRLDVDVTPRAWGGAGLCSCRAISACRRAIIATASRFSNRFRTKSGTENDGFAMSV